ncbi:hypothetical protein FHX64_001352 [Microbacter margulisiae]|uniref:Uncharacterized protein n=1 Tax=Microbacter margulisiae TaxID=1350067 RepID=A0A7W5H224_9PORP|nr:hypothetical protein [Microbacter margulisiae]
MDNKEMVYELKLSSQKRCMFNTEYTYQKINWLQLLLIFGYYRIQNIV